MRFLVTSLRRILEIRLAFGKVMDKSRPIYIKWQLSSGSGCRPIRVFKQAPRLCCSPLLVDAVPSCIFSLFAQLHHLVALPVKQFMHCDRAIASIHFKNLNDILPRKFVSELYRKTGRVGTIFHMLRFSRRCLSARLWHI